MSCPIDREFIEPLLVTTQFHVEEGDIIAIQDKCYYHRRPAVICSTDPDQPIIRTLLRGYVGHYEEHDIPYDYFNIMFPGGFQGRKKYNRRINLEIR